jgi:hypothetical protein
MTQEARRGLDIEELASSQGSLWVVNSSAQVMEGGGGDVYLTIQVGQNGQQSVVEVPLTWLPINLTERVPRKNLLESTYFVQALSTKIIRAIPEEEARKILSRPGADKELNRLQAKKDAVRSETRAKGISKNVTVVNSNIEEETSTGAFYERKDGMTSVMAGKKTTVTAVNSDSLFDEGSEETVSAAFQAWTAKLNTLEDEEEAVNTVRNRGRMSVDEIQYLAENCTHERVVNVMNKWLKENL